MASSGWQGEQTLTSWGGSGAHLAGDVRIDSIVHSGSTVTVSGAVRCALKTNSSSPASTWKDAVTGYVTGGSTVSFGGNFRGTKTAPDARDRSFTATLSAASTATSVTLSVRFAGGSLNTTKSWTLSMGPGGSAPAVPSISIVNVADNNATFNVTESDYGDPASATGRYIEAGIMAQNSYGGTYRAKMATNVSSADITVSNTNYDWGSLVITPNTTYYYGAYANNTVLAASGIAGQFTTLPAYISNVAVSDDGTGLMTITVQHANEGSAYTVYTEYSYDQSNWTAVQDEFHLTVHSPTTLYLRRESDAGTTPIRSVSIVPATTIKLYGSVNDQAKEIHKLYGSVNNQAVRIRKLYGSVNGRSKLIFEDNS